MTEFEGAHAALAQALTKRGYDALTPVQQAVSAADLAGADALVSAQTGSGKTVAFGMAIAPTLLGDAQRFSHAPAPLALIVAPTRELALQVKREFEWLYEMTGAVMASCVGGMDMRGERRALARGAHIVVGTPGRLRDHIERGSFDTTALRAVVLDEADEMLDLGFRDDLEYILDAAPAERRTLMFSATVPRSIETLAKRYQRDAVRITTTSEQKQHLDIEYRALTVAPNDRENAIVNVLRYYEAGNALVFFGTRAGVNHMTSRLTNRGFSVVALSGELSQNERSHALQAMRDGRARICVATDVAARGIDLPNLDLVIHADTPTNRETLLHRSGRTGRAGRKGVCTLIVPYNWRKRAERLLSSANIDATWAKPPSADEVIARDRERLLDDPVFSDPLSDDERNAAREILERFSPEQVAGAFIRQRLADQAAPEELLETSGPERAPKQRTDFKDSVWFSLSVGREQRAEARWLLPMLCRAGHITKHDIGAIRIRDDETYVELAAGCADRFTATVGSGTIEKNITVTRLASPPEAASMEMPRGDPPRDTRKVRDRKTVSKRSDGTDRPQPESEPRPASKPHRKGSSGPHGTAKGKKPPKTAKPFKNKKSGKGKPGKSAVSDRNEGGFTPLKRRKPKQS